MIPLGGVVVLVWWSEPMSDTVFLLTNWLYRELL